MDCRSVEHDLSNLLHSKNSCQYSDITDGVLEKMSFDASTIINILHINIHSFHKNSDSLILLLKDLLDRGIVVHVIGICESFLTEQSKCLANLENYQGYHKCRNMRLGGGVSLYLHDSVSFVKFLDSLFVEDFESIALEIKYKGNAMVVSEFYRPPNGNDNLFMNNLSLLLKACAKYRTGFIGSDQNYNLLKTHVHTQTHDFLSKMFDSGFVPYINKPTRITHATSSLIDNIFVKSTPLKDNVSYVLVEGMSDHYPCILSYAPENKSDKSLTLIEKRKLSDEVI